MGWVREVVRTKKLRIPSGLEFSWPDTEVQRSGYITNTPSIFNYPVQSFATADIIPLVLVLVWHKIKGMQVMITNTIHDSIIAEVPPDEVERYRQILIESFTKDIYWMLDKLYGYKFKVPLGVGIKFGSHWGVGQEEKYGVV
jgi:DNA polymerase family A